MNEQSEQTVASQLQTEVDRAKWLELAVALAGMVLVTVVFALWPLDMQVAGWYYLPGRTGLAAWPYAEQMPWSLLFDLVAWLTASMVILSVVLVGIGLYLGRCRICLVYGLLILLSLALGPGLVVNVIFKDYWGRPRPRQLEQFGGRSLYVVAPLPGQLGGGKSFPCGHASMAFLLCVGYFIFRRRRRGLAWLMLIVSIGLGLAVGYSRVVDGAHFLSDVFWAGLLTFLVTWWCYYYLLKVPAWQQQAGVPPRHLWLVRSPRLAGVIVGLIALGIVLGLALANPFYKKVHFTLPADRLAGDQPITVVLDADQADVSIQAVDQPGLVVGIDGYVRGFGLPTNSVDRHFDYLPDQRQLHIQVLPRGWFAEVEGRLILRIDPAKVNLVRVQLERGDIVCPSGRAWRSVRWQLHIEQGQVQRAGSQPAELY